MTMPDSSPKPAVKKALDAWFAARGWKPFKFQREVWQAIAQGRSGLLHATTGAGKTYAVWLGALMSFMAQVQINRPQSAIKNIADKEKSRTEPLTVLWITPMRALAADTLRALQLPLEVLNASVNDDELQRRAAPSQASPLGGQRSTRSDKRGGDESPRFIAWSAGARSGDTPAAERSAQNRRLPTVLVTTPESLSLLMSRADAKEVLGSVKLVVVDEWHELLGNKRGVQVQLALARLRGFASTLPTACGSLPPKGAANVSPPRSLTACSFLPPEGATPPAVRQSRSCGRNSPGEESVSAPADPASQVATTPTASRHGVSPLVVWGMSATLGNLSEAMHTLLGHDGGVLVQGQVAKKLVIDSLLPRRAERFPWAGHLGLTMLPQVIEEIEKAAPPWSLPTPARRPRSGTRPCWRRGRTGLV